MRWVSEGQVVFVRVGVKPPRYARAVVECPAGDLARLRVEGVEGTVWERVDNLVSEETVALDAARRLI